MAPRPSAPDDPATLAADREEFFRALVARGQSFGEEVESALGRYGDLVVSRAPAFNLISASDRARFYCRHVLECLDPVLVEAVRASRVYVDIGSGAGLPGIPLAIVSPSTRVILVEPRVRRAQFLESALASAGLLERAQIFHGTADRFIEAHVSAEPADLVTARAVDRLDRVWAWAQSILAVGGRLLLFRGADESEATQAAPPDPPPARLEVYPAIGGDRTILVLTKG